MLLIWNADTCSHLEYFSISSSWIFFIWYISQSNVKVPDLGSPHLIPIPLIPSVPIRPFIPTIFEPLLHYKASYDPPFPPNVCKVLPSSEFNIAIWSTSAPVRAPKELNPLV